MSELGSGNGSGYPGVLDTDITKEVDGSTNVRADVPNDLASAIVAIEAELGVNPAGTLTDVKTFLQTEHNTNGTHKTVSVSGAASSPPDANTIYKGNIIKAWAHFTGDGTPVVGDSFNITSVTRGGSSGEEFTITFDRDFADANYAIVATPLYSTDWAFATVTSKAAGSCVITTLINNAGTPDPGPPEEMSIIAIGAQA